MNSDLRRKQISWIVNETSFPASSTVPGEFLRVAKRTPDAIALEIGGEGTAGSLSYGNLSDRALVLARSLVARGVKPGEHVGLATLRDFDVVVGMLGILLAGAAYVPLDVAYPKRRLDFMLRDSGARIVVMSPGLSHELALDNIEVLEIGGSASPANLALPVIGPMNPAYLIYTSGSTGEPKGVVVPNRAVLRLTMGARYTMLGPSRRILQLAPVSFDAATFEIWGALLNGGTCVIYPDAGLPDIAKLRGVLNLSKINTLWLTSSLFNSIVDQDVSVLSPVEELLVGGEALSVEHIRRANAQLKACLVNGYGPTETTTFACCYRIPKDLPESMTSVPIGRPIENTSIAVLDDELWSVPHGEAGELCIAGDGVALGYFNRPELTSERFIAHPEAPGGRFYRTGDIVRVLPGSGGIIEFIGRKDTQVKVAGHRIELGEIEHALGSNTKLKDAAVKVVGSNSGDARIAAWIVPASGVEVPNSSELRVFLEERLPRYMVPSIFTALEAMPLTEVGKLDRNALSIPKRTRPTLEQSYAPPRNGMENFVAATWCELIGIDRVGRHDRFFELGGTSLMAMRFLEICQSKRGLRLSVAEFFDSPTVESIGRIAEQQAAGAPQMPAYQPARATGGRIAIVGLAGRFAGAPDVGKFWEMLMAGRSGRVEITREDLLAAGEDSSLLDDPDYVAAAYPLDGAEDFDPEFFGFTPREAQIMDPQQRILLEVAWNALEDAGHDTRQSSDRVGVFGGVGRNAYLLNNLLSHRTLRESAAEYNMLIGNERDFPSTHIAYRLGLRGPAVNVQTACSTSGVAIHMAAESLRRGECDVALAGGAKVLVPNRVGYRFTEGGPLAPDGYVRAFDARARGMVRGSGAAMVALKRLDDAMADGDHIYAVLIGSAVNNDGDARAGFTAPSVSGQASVIAEAHRKAGIEADSISYIEAHGTGTVLGDPIEVEGLTRAFRATSQQSQYCALGSVKTNIGHLDAGATAAGLIKAALALEHEIIPPSLNYAEPNPSIGFGESPFYVAATQLPWRRGGKPRRAGISSFGLGGTNAHLVIEEAPLGPRSAPAKGPYLIVVSARTDAALAQRCTDLANWLECHESANLADVAHTLRAGRRRLEKRVAMICAGRSDMIAKLRDRQPRDVLRSALAADAPPVAFLFPGGGAQYAGMAKDLYERNQAFREAFDACGSHYEHRTGQSLVELIAASGPALERPSLALPALFAVEYAMARMWQGWGVSPGAMVGHSMGEYTAACLAGVFSLEDAIDIIMCRGRLLETLQPGSMLSVPLPEAALRGRMGSDLSVAAVNRTDQCVVSGPVESVETLAGQLAAEGVETRRVHINVAAHSTLVEPILQEFGQQLRRVSLHAPKLPFLSNLTGDWITDNEATDPGYWVRHLRSTVRFADGVARLLEDPERIFLEIGPGQTLSTFTRQNAARGPGHEVIATIRHPQETTPDDEFLMGAVGRFWLAGGKINWNALAQEPRRRVPLPTYPFERKRMWVDAIPFAAGGETAPAVAEVAAAAPSAEARAENERVPATRRENILAQLKLIIHQLSGLPLARIDEHATFLELGFDSLFLTQANAAFKKAFNVRMTARQLIEATPALDLLAAHLDAALAPGAVIGQAAMPAAVARTGSQTGGAAEARAEDSPGRPTVKKALAADLNAAQESHIDELIATTNRRTPKAKAQTQGSRRVLADPRTVQGFRSRWKEMVYPVLSDQAKGSRIWDVDGNEYIDLVSGYGVTMLGHQPQFVVDAIRAQIGRTLAIGPQSVLAAEVAQLVSDMTGMERVAFCNTGSEAVLAAVRMARTVTGRSKIAKFDGHYHGIFDEMQVRGSGKGSRMMTLPSAPGIPAEAIQNTIILKYGDPEAFEVLREQANDLALVLVEPVRSRNPDFQPREFLLELRRITQELGIPLLFDEIVTGFRCHPGGAQAVFGVRADMATYGKVAGGGLPIGIVTGSAAFMDSLDGGMWRFGDNSVPTADMTWFAGTFVRHPMALASAKATLEYLKGQGPQLQENLNARSARLAGELNAFLREMKAPVKVEQFSSVLRITFKEHQEYSDLLFFHLRNRGILTYEGRPIFLTTAHSDKDLDAIRDAFIASVKALVNVGLLDGRDPSAQRRIPMSAGQQEIWISAQFSTEASCSYNLCSTLTLTGSMDLAVMQAALNDLASRHESLRAVPDRDGLTQVIKPELAMPMVFEDLRALSGVDRDALVAAARRQQVTVPFDLSNGPLVRSQLLRTGEDEHLLLLTAHHMIADGWSCGVMLKDLGELYSARQAGRATALEPAQQLSDYVNFLHQADQRELRLEARDYWLNLHDGGLPRLEFPSDHPRPKVRNYAAHRIEMPMDPEVVAGLRRAALDSGTTLFASLIGGFAAYVTRLTGIAGNPVGFSAAGQPLLGGKGLVGHCVSFLPLRLSTDTGKSFTEHLRGVSAAVLDALEHQNFDFVSFVQELAPQRDGDWAPLVSVGVNLDPSSRHMEFADFEVKAGSVGRAYENLDLFLNFVETNTGVELQCTFNVALHETATMRRRMEEYLRFLASAAADPSAALGTLRFQDPGERHQLAVAWSGTARDYPRDTALAELFRVAAGRHAQATALLLPETQARVTYGELDRLSDRWAARLRQEGVRDGQFVALLLPRSADLIVAILAVLKAGAAYVPIEPNTPAERCEFLIKDSKAAALLTHRANLGQTWAGSTNVIAMDGGVDAAVAASPKIRSGGGDPAYMMYTSGSTGTPKGVVVPHRAVARLVLGNDFARLDETRVIAQLAPAGFDASTFEIWGALLNGGTLVVPGGDGLPELSRLGAILKSSGVTTLWLTAALFNMIVDEDPSILSSVQELLTGGEALSVAHVCRALAALPDTALFNGYGPTENTTFTCCYRIPRDFSASSPSVPIGRPIANTNVYILDAQSQLAPLGVPGELVAGGDGLSLGYWNREELNSQSFVTLELDGVEGNRPLRLYRTGDICRYLPDGNIEFIGRSDGQIKIRGFRIELGEVEAALLDLKNVSKAAVVYEKMADSGRLIAFAVPAAEDVTPERLLRALRNKLPRHLMPSRIRLVPDLPVSKNGKLDRQELLHSSAAQADDIRNLAPVTPTEKELVSIWSDILQRPVTSVEDSFFDLGGHSLMAVRLFDRVRRRFGPDLAISTLFNYPTVRDLAEIVDQEAMTTAMKPAAIDVSADWDTTAVIHPGPGDSSMRPLFIAGGAGGNVNNLAELGRIIGARRPVIGFQTRGIMGHTPHDTIEEMAIDNIRHMRRHQPVGPYLLAGYSAGAQTAFEMARQLVASGQAVSEVVLLDTYAPGFVAGMGGGNHFVVPIRLTWQQRLQHELGLLRERGLSYLAERSRAKLDHLVLRGRVLDWLEGIAPILVRSRKTSDAWMTAAHAYKGGHYDGAVTLVLSKPVGMREELLLSRFPDLGWDKLTNPSRFKRHFINSTHLGMIEGNSAKKLAGIIEAALSASEARN